MLTRTSYRNSFYTSLNQGGGSNSLIINELISKYKGFRSGSVLNNVGSNGYYWSSTDYDSDYAYCVGFSSSNVNHGDDFVLSKFGYSIRLVTEVK